MGNCCGAPSAQEGGARKKDRRKQKQNPYTVAYNRPTPARPGLVVLRDPMGRDLDARHVLGGELGRGDFGVTYLCTEAATGARMACKSISKCKLRTPVDIEDMRREVEIMRHMPPHPNIVSLSAAYEDDDAMHLVIEARAASSSTGSLPGDTTPSAPPRPSCAPSSRSSGCATGMASSIGTLNQKTSYMQRRVLL